MFNWKTIVTLVVIMPFVALLGGVGILCYQIGQQWDTRSTDSLIAGLVATCGGGAVIIGVLLAIIIGVPFAIRMFREAGHSSESWSPPHYPPSLPSPTRPSWMQQPPMIEDKSQGSWNTMSNSYDTWDDPNVSVIEADWRSG